MPKSKKEGPTGQPPAEPQTITSNANGKANPGDGQVLAPVINLADALEAKAQQASAHVSYNPTPAKTASQIFADGIDPFSVEAIKQAFKPENCGRFSSENGTLGFIDAALSESAIAYMHAIYAHERFYAFIDHHYVDLDDSEVQRFLADIIQTHVSPKLATARRTGEVRKLMAVKAFWPEDRANAIFNAKEIVVFRNGVLELPSLAFRPGRPEDYMTMRVNCDWAPEVGPGAVDKFIWTLLAKDDILPLLQFIGYAMVAGAPSLEKYAILLGAGENGKTRLLLLISALFAGYSASISFQDLSTRPFERSNLLGKMINLVGDMSASHISDTSVIKTLSGGDIIHADQKFKRPIEFVNRAKSLISTNELFSTSDHTWGFYRRTMIFAFERDFREGGKDEHIRDPLVVENLLSDPETLPRLARLAVYAYLTLRETGRFAESARMQVFRSQFRVANDSVVAFTEEALEEQEGARIGREALYRAFALWCKATGHATLGENKFWQRWATSGPKYAYVVQPRNPDGTRPRRMIANVALRDDIEVMVSEREQEVVTLTEAINAPATLHADDNKWPSTT